MYGWRGRIGIIIPSSNTTMEPEFWIMAPEGVSVHSSRIALREVTEEELMRMHDHVRDSSRLLSDAKVDVIVFGCTSGSFIGGLGYDTKITQEIEESTGIPAVSTSTAVLDALRTINARKIGLATPYIDEVTLKEKEFLEANGFKVVKYKGLGIKENTKIGSLGPEEAYRIAKEVYTQDVDAVFISCTNFRTIEVIDALEEDLKIPIITSNQASMWAALRKIGIRERYSMFGRLLKEFL
ncbi:MAG: aspartate/glutamate racemase family protein [Euryarchaeota archaeon]|nr:aspartate/glutamate racemase family protein [Euryarchaeota archaeon]